MSEWWMSPECERCGNCAISYLRNHDKFFCQECLTTYCLEQRLEKIEKRDEEKMKYGSMFHTNKERLQYLAAHDIGAWMQYNYIYNDGKCPTCDVKFFDMHPQSNMYPHWKRKCTEEKQ